MKSCTLHVPGSLYQCTLITCSKKRGALSTCIARPVVCIANKSSAVAEMDDRGHNRHGPKNVWGCAPFFWGGSWVPIEHKVAWAEAYLHTKWHLDASRCLATIEMGQKLRGSAPFLGRVDGSPSSTMWPRLRPTSMPSTILIHPAVWPQQILSLIHI